MALKGQEMIYELIQTVEEFLYEHNKPATKSFYEEMVIRKREKELQERRAKEMEREKEVGG